MRAAFDGVNIIHVRLNVLGKLATVLQRDLVLGAILFADDLNHISMKRIAGTVEMFDKFDDSAFVFEIAPFAVPLVVELDVHAAIEKGEFLQPFVQRVKTVFGRTEDLIISFEGRFRAGLFGHAALAHRSRWNTAFLFLGPSETVAADFRFGQLTEEVHNGDTHSVQSAGGLVGAFFELAAELQHRHHTLERTDFAIEFL